MRFRVRSVWKWIDRRRFSKDLGNTRNFSQVFEFFQNVNSNAAFKRSPRRFPGRFKLPVNVSALYSGKFHLNVKTPHAALRRGFCLLRCIRKRYASLLGKGFLLLCGCRQANFHAAFAPCPLLFRCGIQKFLSISSPAAIRSFSIKNRAEGSSSTRSVLVVTRTCADPHRPQPP